MTIYYAKRTRIVTYRKNFLVALIALLGTVAGVSLLLAFPVKAHAATPPAAVVWSACPNLRGWYVNDDETAQRPAATTDGLLFAGKNLIHHATAPIDLADMDKVTAGYSSTNSGKVVFKVETSAPYSTIITDADGKLWSTAMTADQPGGQGHPVVKYSDLVGLDTKPGKAHFDAGSAVTTFGVGYWTEDGTTTVTAIDFHGKTYDLSCHPAKPTPSGSSSAPTAKPSTSASNPHHVSTTPAPPANGPRGGQGGPALAVTGPSWWTFAAVAVGLSAFGSVLFIAARRRRIDWKA